MREIDKTFYNFRKNYYLGSIYTTKFDVRGMDVSVPRVKRLG